MRRATLIFVLLPAFAACSGAAKTDYFAAVDPDAGDASAETPVTVTSADAGIPDASTDPGEGGPSSDGGPVADAKPADPPDATVDPPTPPPTLSSTWQHACVIKKGKISCWGDNEYGASGPGSMDFEILSPLTVPKVTDAIAVAAGIYQTCAIRKDGTVACWGGSDGVTVVSKVVQVEGITDAVRIGGGGKMCVVRADKTVSCWSPVLSPSPQPVKNLTDVTQITGTISAQCALRASGQVVCFGKNTHGELGNGTTTDSATPVPVKGVDDAREISAGGYTTCAIRRSGAVVCWGSPATPPDLVPKAVEGITDAVTIGVGPVHRCVTRKGSESVFCWGENSSGALGNGTTTASETPVEVKTIKGMTRVVAGYRASCATNDDVVFCWGSNAFGQLGIGTEVRSLVPVAVEGL